jgi:glyoxylase-like metal-dependent hydrolase (beta-lactamase superfamily II)
VGDLRIRVLHVPGHTVGQLAFVIEDVGVFTGDTLFRGTVGGTCAPGHATFAELRHSIEVRLLTLPDELTVYPGHMDPTTIGDEREHNPFVRLWSGRLEPAGTPCTALGRPATLALRAPDYDGGTKCQVRWDDGTEDVVPGSRVHDA